MQSDEYRRLFYNAYNLLNPAQKEAVDTIDGPVLVIAGPGTGKTQLLALRAANILLKDPTVLPGNILCLTFTDAAAHNMRERLIRFIGPEAYQVGIYTFNSFGAMILATYPEYFYEWREITTVDALTSHQIIESILGKLPPTHILAGQDQDGGYYCMKQIQSWIADNKRANVSPSNLLAILDDNKTQLSELERLINESWPKNIRAKNVFSEQILPLTEKLLSRDDEILNEPIIEDIARISSLVLQDLRLALLESSNLEPTKQTKPFTAWKEKWLEKNSDGNLQFKAQKNYDKLIEATKIYELYQQELTRNHAADFNDQINWVIKALQKNSELRLNLQERFQYIMVDEYQDTNRAQLQLASLVTNADVNEGRPNILAVGDDDQAIYKFQGADISNIASFLDKYREPRRIKLTENYRSNSDIIGQSKQVSQEIKNSLEKLLNETKELHENKEKTGQGVQLKEFSHTANELSWVSSNIQSKLQVGIKGDSIAVLARERAQLDALVPYLRQLSIPINYERRENVLEQTHIVLLLNLCRLVQAFSEQDHNKINWLLPTILAHPMWAIEPSDLWKISLAAHQQKTTWTEHIIELDVDNQIRKIVDFFISLGLEADTTPLENMLDKIIGITQLEDEDDQKESTSTISAGQIRSPFKNYFFSHEIQQENPSQYLTLLSHLSTLRKNLRQYNQAQNRKLVLSDMLTFCDQFQRAGLVMIDASPHREDSDAIPLMTVHKSKGLEFDTVYIIGAEESIWSRKNTGNGRFSYPENLRVIKPGASDTDDSLRLLFVGMTRAEQTLVITYSLHNDTDKPQQPYSPLLNLSAKVDRPEVITDTRALVEQYEQKWLHQHGSRDSRDLHYLLKNRLENYQLSVTDFNNFLNVKEGGPNYFLTFNLLHFPSAMSPSAAYGSVIHSVLRKYQHCINEDREMTIDEVLYCFEQELKKTSLSDNEYSIFYKKGIESLPEFIAKKRTIFAKGQKPEVDFRNEGVVVNGTHLKGVIDSLELDQLSKTVRVLDYKTGKPESKWDLPPSSTEHQKIKLHHYRNQLLFYKLLVDNSSSFGKRGYEATEGRLQFIEPDQYGTIRCIELKYNDDELLRFKQLVKAVHGKISALNFPDTEIYPPTLDGIKQFENDLMAGC